MMVSARGQQYQQSMRRGNPMTRRLLIQYLAGVMIAGRGHTSAQRAATRCEEGWALMDADRTFRTRSMIGQPADKATLFADHEVDGYAKAWGVQKVWMRRTVTISCETVIRPQQLSA